MGNKNWKEAKKTPRWHYYAIVHFILALFSILAIASAFQMIFNMECLTSEKKKAAVRRPQFYLVSIIKFHEYITMTDWLQNIVICFAPGTCKHTRITLCYTTLAYVVLLNWAWFMHATELQINRDVPHGKDILISTDKYRMAMYLTMALAHWWMCPHSWTSVWGCGGPLHKAKLVEKGRAPHLSHGLQCNDGVHPELSHPTLCSFKMRVQNNMLTLMQSVP